MQGPFTKDTLPAFDGHTLFAAYKQDLELWINLTTLEAKRQGPAIVGRLSLEPKLLERPRKCYHMF